MNNCHALLDRQKRRWISVLLPTAPPADAAVSPDLNSASERFCTTRSSELAAFQKPSCWGTSHSRKTIPMPAAAPSPLLTRNNSDRGESSPLISSKLMARSSVDLPANRQPNTTTTFAFIDGERDLIANVVSDL